MQRAIPYIGAMDIAPLWDQLGHAVGRIPQSGLLLAAVGAMAVGLVGTLFIRHFPLFGRLLRTTSTLGLMGILLLVVMQVSRMDPRFDFAMPGLGMPEQVVEGAETRVAMARDGHFWLSGTVNGVPARFLVDTGATITAVSVATAEEAGLDSRGGGLPIMMQTANGPVAAEMTSIEELRFGNVAARGLDAIIAPGLGNTNVMGMNLLSRLASWRVEGETMILVPHHPQPVVEAVD